MLFARLLILLLWARVLVARPVTAPPKASSPGTKWEEQLRGVQDTATDLLVTAANNPLVQRVSLVGGLLKFLQASYQGYRWFDKKFINKNGLTEVQREHLRKLRSKHPKLLARHADMPFWYFYKFRQCMVSGGISTLGWREDLAPLIVDAYLKGETLFEEKVRVEWLIRSCTFKATEFLADLILPIMDHSDLLEEKERKKQNKIGGFIGGVVGKVRGKPRGGSVPRPRIKG